MSKYNIISKEKGNKQNKKYTIVYQVDGQGNKKFEVDLICLGKFSDGGKIQTNKYGVAYAFMEGYNSPHIKSSKDRQEFIDELYEFQKGSQYRRTHPIQRSETEEQILKLKAAKADFIDKITEVNKSITQLEENCLKAEYEATMKGIDNRALDKFKRNLRQVWEDERYSVEPNIFICKYVYDKKQNKPIGMLYEDSLHKLVIKPIDFDHYKQVK